MNGREVRAETWLLESVVGTGSGNAVSVGYGECYDGEEWASHRLS